MGLTAEVLAISRSSERTLVGQTKDLTAEDLTAEDLTAEVAEVAEARTEKSTNAPVSIGQLGSRSRSRSHLATQDERSGRCSAAARQDEPRPERMAFRMHRASKVPLSL